MSKGLMLAAALLFAGSAAASQPVDFDGEASFAEQREQLLLDLGDGETYQEITPEDRETVFSTLRRMQTLLGESGTPAALHPDDRVALFNQQETVNNILTQARKDSRTVCTREKPVGTRFPTTVCLTVAERRRRQDNSRQQFEAAGRGRANTIL